MTGATCYLGAHDPSIMIQEKWPAAYATPDTSLSTKMWLSSPTTLAICRLQPTTVGNLNRDTSCW